MVNFSIFKVNLYLYFIFIFFCSCSSPKYINNIDSVEEIYATIELESLLKDSNYNINDSIVLIKDPKTAIKIAEVFLFETFGKNYVLNQRPYKIFHIKNYWIIEGTLPKGRKGGFFSIIIDDRNSRVLKITQVK